MFSGIICLLTNYGCITAITAISPISAISADAACKKKAYGFIYYNQNVYYDCMAAEGLYCETKTYDGWCEMWGTPLHLAASNDSKSEVELLLSKGTNVNVKNDVGWTPLHSAVAQGHKGMVELLLSKGAEVNAKTDNGHTPLHFAKEKDHKDVVRLLLQHGGKSN
jgi:hypothetical protein